MPLQHFYPDNFRTPEAVVDMVNEVIDHANALEARLSALEHPVERLSEETVCTCTTNTMSPCKKCNR